MANVLTFGSTLQNTLASAVETAVGSTATLEFQLSGGTEVATLTLASDPFTGPSSGVITLAGTPLQDTSATGNASPMARFQIKSAGTTMQVQGTVGVSGEAINFAGGVTVDPGDTVELTSFTISFA
jgi:hypothetical protein